MTSSGGHVDRDDPADAAGLLGELQRARPRDDLEDQRVRALVAAQLFDEPVVSVTVDRFTLLGQVGSGGAGVVHAAYDPRLDRRVAIKILHAEADDQAAARLLREAKAAARLSHPNVVAVFDVGRWGERVYLAMEFASGVDLGSWLRASPREPQEVVSAFIEAGRGLAAAHRAGIVHRDFKPSNVIVTEEPGERRRVRVVDFGLARFGPARERERTTNRDTPAVDTDQLTRTGQAMGTPAYMAPEQFEGGVVDASSDQFSFCVALSEALGGARPFATPGSFELLDTALRRVPARIAPVLRRGLSIEPSQRYASMDELLDALDPATRWTRPAGVAALGAVLLGSAWFAASSSGEATVDPCAAIEPAVIYDDAQHDAVAAAFAATSTAGAAATWERLAPRLRDQARALHETQTKVCRARERAEFSESLHDRALACLSRSAAGLQALVASLREVDRGTVDHALELVEGLEPTACADPAHLDSRVPAPDPQWASAVEAAQRNLERARVAEGLARYAEAREQLDLARHAVEPGVYLPLDAEHALREGVVDGSTDRREQARARLEEAYRTSDEVGDERLRLAAAVALAKLLDETDLAAAAVWAEVAGAGARRTETSPTDRFAALLASSRVAFEQGRYVRSKELAQEALQHIETAQPGRGSLAADARLMAATNAYWLQELDEAETLTRRVVDDLTGLLGREHPRVGAALNQLGHVERRRGREAAAEAAYREALAIFEHTQGSASSQAAAVRGALALLAEMRGDLKQAKVEYEAAIEAMKRAHGPRSGRVAALYDNYGIALAQGGELAAAEAAIRTALELGIESVGPEHPELASTHVNLGSVLADGGRDTEAVPHFERAVALREQAFGRQHVSLLSALENLSHAQSRLGAYADALSNAERALAIAEAGEGPTSARLVDPLRARAEALRGLERDADADAAIARADELERAQGAAP